MGLKGVAVLARAVLDKDFQIAVFDMTKNNNPLDQKISRYPTFYTHNADKWAKINISTKEYTAEAL